MVVNTTSRKVSLVSRVIPTYLVHDAKLDRLVSLYLLDAPVHERYLRKSETVHRVTRITCPQFQVFYMLLISEPWLRYARRLIRPALYINKIYSDLHPDTALGVSPSNRYPTQLPTTFNEGGGLNRVSCTIL